MRLRVFRSDPRVPSRRRLIAASVAAAIGVAVPSAVLAPDAGAAALPSLPGAAWTTGIGPTHLSSPVVADVNGDGHLDVLTTDLGGLLHVFDGRNGRDLPGWPQPVQPRAGSTTGSESSPTVADLDRNGQKEIIVGAGSLNVGGQGGIVAFNANGSVRFRVQTMTILGQSGVVGNAGRR